LFCCLFLFLFLFCFLFFVFFVFFVFLCCFHSKVHTISYYSFIVQGYRIYPVGVFDILLQDSVCLIQQIVCYIQNSVNFVIAQYSKTFVTIRSMKYSWWVRQDRLRWWCRVCLCVCLQLEDRHVCPHPRDSKSFAIYRTV
jgi:hypothetical protein